MVIDHIILAYNINKIWTDVMTSARPSHKH